MDRLDEVYSALAEFVRHYGDGASASDISAQTDIDRSTASRYLNELCRTGRAEKTGGRPVLYRPCPMKEDAAAGPAKQEGPGSTLDMIIGADNSLKAAIKLAKAAVLYPPDGLSTLILGETGVGKSMFAEAMFRFAIESDILSPDAAFVNFNCADYADNPQLLLSQLFGVRKGAYTGADADRPGLFAAADGGMIFLDEIHRLPPQGQEMLFTYMDKGYFRPLGAADETVSAKVRIVAATTEEPDSFLLKTFTRRIPILINLPPLRDRSLSERFSLASDFLGEEAGRVNCGIYADRDSFMSFLLYDCPGNVGQLKSDIQIACAKSFLDLKSQKKEYLFISPDDLPPYVKRAIMKVHDYRDEFDSLLPEGQDILFFSADGEADNTIVSDDGDVYFYDVIERKLDILKGLGIGEDEMNQILNGEIEKHFRKYIQKMPGRYRKDEISKITGENVIETTEEILDMAEKRLGRYMDERIFFGLALHLQKTIDRVKSGSRIYNPRTNFIRVNHPDEFVTAIEAARIIDNTFNIETPLDEIGYLAMFFVEDDEGEKTEEKGKVGILIVMHGNSTASSMAQVTNELVGAQHAIGLDMPLSLNSEKMYGIVKENVIKADKGRGVLLLVDMGSLKNFGDIISEETGIEVKTVDMVTTLTAIDACHKAVLGRELREIYRSSAGINCRSLPARLQDRAHTENIIITACFTGKGAAEELKRLLKDEYLKDMEDIRVISMEFIDRSRFIDAVKKYRESYNILAIVGTMDCSVGGIPFISAVDLLTGRAGNAIAQMIDQVNTLDDIRSSLSGYLSHINGGQCFKASGRAVDAIEEELGIRLMPDVKIGIMMHLCFLAEKIASGGTENTFEDIDDYGKIYGSQMETIKQHLKEIESICNIDIGRHECAYLCRTFLENTSETA